MAITMDAKYDLTELGKMLIERAKAHPSLLDRTRAGTLAFWGMRKNERVRQIKKVKHVTNDQNVQNWKKWMRQYLPQSIKLYERMYDRAIEYLETLIADHNEELLRENVERYITEMEKEDISLSPHFQANYTYLRNEEMLPVAIAMVAFLKMMKGNLYSRMRVAVDFILAALRNRPEDIEVEKTFDKNGELLEKVLIDANSEKAYMDRSRAAEGQPPHSHFWMLIYPIKHEIITEFLNSIKKLYHVNFKTPITDDNFYYEFTHFVPGLYLFGDNGCQIKSGEMYIYDLSISDIMQAHIRQGDKGENMSFYQRLGEGYDAGTSGDPFTTLWNIEGQVVLWLAYQEGDIDSFKGIDAPTIKEVLEPAAGFLGHIFDYDLNMWLGGGAKFTRDNSTDRISCHLNKGLQTTFNWTRRDRIDYIEFCQVAVPTGIVNFNYSKFWDWVKHEGLTAKSFAFGEMGSSQESIGHYAKLKSESFLSHFDVQEMIKLARPGVLVNIPILGTSEPPRPDKIVIQKKDYQMPAEVLAI